MSDQHSKHPFFVIFAVAFAASCMALTEDDYVRIFEEIDSDFILDNERILQSYLKCFFNEIECSSHAELVKRYIPEVLSTVCGACTEKQKGIFKHDLNRFIPSHPKEWERLLTIYDPSGEAWPKVKAFLES